MHSYGAGGDFFRGPFHSKAFIDASVIQVTCLADSAPRSEVKECFTIPTSAQQVSRDSGVGGVPYVFYAVDDAA